MWFMLFVRKFLFTVLINAFFFFFPVPPPPPPSPSPTDSPPCDSTPRLLHYDSLKKPKNPKKKKKKNRTTIKK